MPSSRARTGIVAAAAVVMVGGVLLLTGALAERDDPRIPPLAVGEQLATSLADVTVDAFEPGDEPGTIALTVTVTAHTPESLSIDEVMWLVDDDGELARYGSTSIGDVDGVVASNAQPGVEETFVTVYEPERAPVGDVRLEIVDGVYTPRDDTAFGIGSNVYDVRVVAIVSMP